MEEGKSKMANESNYYANTNNEDQIEKLENLPILHILKDKKNSKITKDNMGYCTTIDGEKVIWVKNLKYFNNNLGQIIKIENNSDYGFLAEKKKAHEVYLDDIDNTKGTEKFYLVRAKEAFQYDLNGYFDLYEDENVEQKIMEDFICSGKIYNFPNTSAISNGEEVFKFENKIYFRPKEGEIINIKQKFEFERFKNKHESRFEFILVIPIIESEKAIILGAIELDKEGKLLSLKLNQGDLYDLISINRFSTRRISNNKDELKFVQYELELYLEGVNKKSDHIKFPLKIIININKNYVNIYWDYIRLKLLSSTLK